MIRYDTYPWATSWVCLSYGLKYESVIRSDHMADMNSESLDRADFRVHISLAQTPSNLSVLSFRFP